MKRMILSLGVCSVMVLFASCNLSDSKKKVETPEVNTDSITMVEIPDALFKAYLLENFDTNKDGNISVAEAKGVKKINCSGLGIEKLDGIEKFANLESLDCSDNQLEEMELRYNKKLNKLVCTGNKVPVFLYIGMSSPLRNPALQKPKSNEPPKNAAMATMMLDESKCTYDKESTNITLSFDD